MKGTKRSELLGRDEDFESKQHLTWLCITSALTSARVVTCQTHTSHLLDPSSTSTVDHSFNTEYISIC